MTSNNIVDGSLASDSSVSNVWETKPAKSHECSNDRQRTNGTSCGRCTSDHKQFHEVLSFWKNISEQQNSSRAQYEVVETNAPNPKLFVNIEENSKEGVAQYGYSVDSAEDTSTTSQNTFGSPCYQPKTPVLSSIFFDDTTSVAGQQENYKNSNEALFPIPSHETQQKTESVNGPRREEQSNEGCEGVNLNGSNHDSTKSQEISGARVFLQEMSTRSEFDMRRLIIKVESCCEDIYRNLRKRTIYKHFLVSHIKLLTKDLDAKNTALITQHIEKHLEKKIAAANIIQETEKERRLAKLKMSFLRCCCKNQRD